MVTILVRDETSSREATGEFSLDFLTERVTAREIIRSRIYQEVSEFNARRTKAFRGLVQPQIANTSFAGEQNRKALQIDWEKQFDVAISSFLRNGFLLLIDDRQITDLDAEIELHFDTRVSFLKLVPLIGG